MAEKSAKKYTEEFVYALAKCDIASFLGVAKILGIKVDTLREGADKDNLTKEDIEIRPFEDVISEIIDRFDGLGRSERKQLYDVVRKATSADKVVKKHGKSN